MKRISPVVTYGRRHGGRLAVVAMGALILMATFGNVGAQAEPLTGCAAKTHQIEQELDAAQRAHADNARIAGLRVALVKSRQCDDKALASERAVKVEEKQRKVSERQETLDRELRDGDANRISRAKQKLDKETDELHKALAEQSS